MRKIVAFAFATMLATPAMAQDIQPRVEFTAGYDRVKLGVDVEVDGSPYFAFEEADDGIAYGGEIGLDFAVSDRVKVGPYAGVSFSDTDYCDEEAGVYSYCLDTGRQFAAGLQVTGAVGPKLSTFAKLGWANGRLTGDYVDAVDASYNYSDAVNRDAFQVGAGLQFALGANAYATTQVVYTDFDAEEASIDTVDGRLYGSRLNLLGGLGVRF